tara:strand:- start:12479 stop:12850 length:372 start_codon:yes stop_codon:yes gene_type:complete
MVQEKSNTGPTREGAAEESSRILKAFGEETNTLSGCLDLMERVLEEDIREGKEIRSDKIFLTLDDRYNVLIETRYLGTEISAAQSRYSSLQKKLKEYTHGPRQKGIIIVGRGGIKTVSDSHIK